MSRRSKHKRKQREQSDCTLVRVKCIGCGLVQQNAQGEEGPEGATAGCTRCGHEYAVYW